MGEPRLTVESFQSLAEHAGLSLSPSQAKELREAYRHVEAMTERVRARGRPALLAESAMVFCARVPPR